MFKEAAKAWRRYNALPYILLILVTALAPTRTMAQTNTLTILHHFQGAPNDGDNALGALVYGLDGNLYGTTQKGGTYDVGTIYRCTPAGVVTVLHSFDGFDGQYPPAGLVRASDGDLYGVVGDSGAAGVYGHIFKISTAGVFTDLHDMTIYDGQNPQGPLIQGTDGNFYGLAAQGGAYGFGTFFKMTPTGTFSVIYSLHANLKNPAAGLIDGGDGYFYGSSEFGGNASGVFFKISAAGVPTGLVVLNAGTSGHFPEGPVLHGGDGLFYGTTSAGYTSNGSVVSFGSVTVHPTSDFNFRDAASPRSSLIQDAGGIIYGIMGQNPGGVFYFDVRLNYLTNLFLFSGPTGTTPMAGLASAGDGSFFGTTTQGGTYGHGTLYNLAFGLAAPAWLVAVANTGPVSLQWYAVAGATSYNVYRGTAAGAENSTPLATGVPPATYSDTTAVLGTPYYYMVQAVNAFGVSTGSNEISIIPTAPPTGITVTPGNGHLDLSWNAVAGAAGYQILRSVASQSESAYATSASTTYSDTGVNNGTRYYYTIITLVSSGASVASAEVSGIPSGGPPAPTNVTAQSGNAQVVLSWTASVNATSYNVYRGTASGAEGGTPVATGITALTFTDTGLTVGAPYFYTVTAVASGGESAPSSEVTATPGGPPPVPTGLTAVATAEHITLSWNASAGATSYKVYRATTAGGEGSTPIASGFSTSFTNIALTDGVTYYYTVASVGAYTSAQSAEVHAMPMAIPANLTATAGNARVVLRWTASPGATSYNVYRATTSYGQTTPYMTGIATATFTDTGVTNGTTYYYRVAAFNSYGNSPEGNQASGTPNTIPAVPINLTGVAGSTKVTLSWTGSAGATSYSIYRATTSYGQTGTPTKAGVTGTTYVDTGLTNGVTYYYRVAAFNNVGNSPEGNQVSVKPIPIPTVPTNLTATAVTGQVTLNWTASTGATSYNVYRATTSYGQTTPLVTGITSTTYVDTAVTHGVTYYYRVAGFNSAGNSPEGNQASGKP